jgi:cytochrome b subunit of formate dehydrogenase
MATDGRRHNAGMSVFYWFMAVVMAATLLPSVLYLGIYVFTGEDEAMRRASKFWNFLRVFTLLAFNITLWGHVLVGVWDLLR